MNSVHEREPLLAGATVVIACVDRESDLTRQVAQSLRLGAQHVIVDLGGVQMLDSSTLTALKRLGNRLRSGGGRLSVVCEHPALATLLDLTLLSHSFHVFGSLDAALRTA